MVCIVSGLLPREVDCAEDEFVSGLTSALAETGGYPAAAGAFGAVEGVELFPKGLFGAFEAIGGYPELEEGAALGAAAGADVPKGFVGAFDDMGGYPEGAADDVGLGAGAGVELFPNGFFGAAVDIGG